MSECISLGRIVLNYGARDCWPHSCCLSGCIMLVCYVCVCSQASKCSPRTMWSSEAAAAVAAAIEAAYIL